MKTKNPFLSRLSTLSLLTATLHPVAWADVREAVEPHISNEVKSRPTYQASQNLEKEILLMEKAMEEMDTTCSLVPAPITGWAQIAPVPKYFLARAHTESLINFSTQLLKDGLRNEIPEAQKRDKAMTALTKALSQAKSKLLNFPSFNVDLERANHLYVDAEEIATVARKIEDVLSENGLRPLNFYSPEIKPGREENAYLAMAKAKRSGTVRALRDLYSKLGSPLCEHRMLQLLGQYNAMEERLAQLEREQREPIFVELNKIADQIADIKKLLMRVEDLAGLSNGIAQTLPNAPAHLLF